MEPRRRWVQALEHERPSDLPVALWPRFGEADLLAAIDVEQTAENE